MKNISIIFDNPSDIVYSGQLLTGKVQINVDSTKKIKAISILVKGESTVQWKRKEQSITNGREQYNNISYYSHEDYINEKIYLLGSANSSSIELSSGEHNYGFNLQMPQRAPSSFEGEKGFIRYTTKVTVERPWKFDKVIKKSFTVIAPLDLNYCYGVRNAITVSAHKKFHSCFFFKSGQMILSVSIPHTGYVSGQPVLFTISIENTSRTSIRNVKYILYKTVTYHSTWPRKISIQNREIVTQFKSGRSFASRTNTTFNERFMIPFVPPSSLINCAIIDIFYEIHIKLKLSGNNLNLDAILPIQIGSIPLVDLESSTLTDPNSSLGLNSTQGHQSIGWDPNISDSSTTFLLPPPPSYEEISAKMAGKPPAYPGFNPNIPNVDGAGPSAPSASP